MRMQNALLLVSVKYSEENSVFGQVCYWYLFNVFWVGGTRKGVGVGGRLFEFEFEFEAEGGGVGVGANSRLGAY